MYASGTCYACPKSDWQSKICVLCIRDPTRDCVVWFTAHWISFPYRIARACFWKSAFSCRIWLKLEKLHYLVDTMMSLWIQSTKTCTVQSVICHWKRPYRRESVGIDFVGSALMNLQEVGGSINCLSCIIMPVSSDSWSSQRLFTCFERVFMLPEAWRSEAMPKLPATWLVDRDFDFVRKRGY